MINLDRGLVALYFLGKEIYGYIHGTYGGCDKLCVQKGIYKTF